jgi:Holliday junction resolvase RusA-like endonuclease
MKELFIKTVPIPKGRPRFYGGHAVTPEKTRKYEKLIRDSWTHGIVEGKSIMVDIEFRIPIPQSYSKKKKAELEWTPQNKKPDLDNLVKAVLDALNGVAFEDDSLISDINASKTYAEEPGVYIMVHGR